MRQVLYSPTTGAKLGTSLAPFQVYTLINNLNATQKTNVQNDLFTGATPKIVTSDGPNAGAILVLYWAVQFSGAAGASLTAAKILAAALYTLDNPLYLQAPAFDPSITVIPYT